MNKFTAKAPSESTFDMLFDKEEATNLKMRASLMYHLERHVRDNNLSKAEAAAQFGAGRPLINDLLAGNINCFTIDELVDMCTAAGIEVEVCFPSSA